MAENSKTSEPTSRIDRRDQWPAFLEGYRAALRDLQELSAPRIAVVYRDPAAAALTSFCDGSDDWLHEPINAIQALLDEPQS